MSKVALGANEAALGVDEIKLNVGRLVDGVQRSAKDELMREKMDKE